MRRIFTALFLIAVVGFTAACGGGGGGSSNNSGSSNPSAKIETTMGEIVIELFEDEAPIAVANFIGLAEGTKPPATEPFYDGVIFHRVVPGFMIQGGSPNGQGNGGPGYTFEDEFSSGLQFDQVGRVGMANSGPDSNGSQFFILDGAPQSHLNNVHTIFGQVTSGQEVVNAIANVARDPNNNRPNNPPVMTKVTILRP